LKHPRITSIPFGERPGAGRDPYNASDIVGIGDSRFLFCDNNIGDSLFELRLASDGRMAGPLERRPINGIPAGSVDDLEAMATADEKLIFAVPSLSLKKRKKKTNHHKKSKRGKAAPARNGLLRVSVRDDQQLQADVIPDFRSWLIDHIPELKKAARRLPDDGGLNIEGLGWSPSEQALLVGLRTPVLDRKPLIHLVRVKEINGPWTTDNLEMRPGIALAIEEGDDEQGIRCIAYDEILGVHLFLVGNSTSASKAPFTLYSWDGNAQGRVHRFRQVRFHKKMKVEGVTHGTIGGRGALVFVDDAGGYQTLWDDDPRLK
jgi:hypothetical protein